jgi:hypothetical protein
MNVNFLDTTELRNRREQRIKYRELNMAELIRASENIQDIKKLRNSLIEVTGNSKIETVIMQI